MDLWVTSLFLLPFRLFQFPQASPQEPSTFARPPSWSLNPPHCMTRIGDVPWWTRPHQRQAGAKDSVLPLQDNYDPSIDASSRIQFGMNRFAHNSARFGINGSAQIAQHHQEGNSLERRSSAGKTCQQHQRQARALIACQTRS